MGQSKSTAQDLTENGVVNSNFVVQQEQEYNVTKDVKIILYLLVAMMAASLGIKLFQIYMREKTNSAKFDSFNIQCGSSTSAQNSRLSERKTKCRVKWHLNVRSIVAISVLENIRNIRIQKLEVL